MKVGPLWDKEKGSLFFFYAGVASLYSKNSKPASLLRIEIRISQFEGKAKKKNRKKNNIFLYPNTRKNEKEKKKKKKKQKKK